MKGNEEEREFINEILASLHNMKMEKEYHGSFDFPGDFKNSYERNNKQNGKKNLKCFPTCKEDGHVSHTYCGAPLTATFSFRYNALFPTVAPPPEVGDEIMIFASFVAVDDVESNHELVGAIQIGSHVPAHVVDGLKRSRKSSCTRVLPFIKGKLIREVGHQHGQYSQTFIFNHENLGWHYGWTSTKRKNDSRHALRMFVFINSSTIPGRLKCVDYFDSPAFTIYSRRRRGKVATNNNASATVTTSQSMVSLFSEKSSMVSLDSNITRPATTTPKPRLKRYMSSTVTSSTSNGTSKRRMLKHFTSSFCETAQLQNELPELHVI